MLVINAILHLQVQLPVYMLMLDKMLVLAPSIINAYISDCGLTDLQVSGFAAAQAAPCLKVL